MRTPSPLLPVLLAALAAAGCATRNIGQPLDIGRSANEYSIQAGIANVGVDRREEGIFVSEDDGSLRVKLWNRPLVSAIDELAYKSGFNYTMLSDLTRFRATIGDAPAGAKSASREALAQKAYQSERALLDDLVAQVQVPGRPKLKLRYRWLADGPELFLSESADGDPTRPGVVICSLLNRNQNADCDQSMTYKKIFLKNVTVDEAIKSLTDLFGSEIEARRQPLPLQMQDAGMNVNPYQQMMDQAAMAQQQAPAEPPAPKVSVTPYKAQNALLVRGKNAQIYDRIGGIMPSIDSDFQQIMVETKVYEYNDSTARKLGVALDFSKTNGGNTFGITSQFGEGITAALPNFFANLSDTEKRATLLSKLALQDSDGIVRILAEPHLILKSGEDAEVKLQTKQYYATTGVNSPGDLRELSTGIVFKVSPTVLGNNKVLLNLSVVQSEFIPSNSANVTATTTQNEIRTSIIARDGELVSLGGIHSKKDSKFSSGIPWLRNLPGAGFAFGSQQGESSVVRVEFMIRPIMKRVQQRNRDVLKNITDTNCRISAQMGKPLQAECIDQQNAPTNVIDLDDA